MFVVGAADLKQKLLTVPGVKMLRRRLERWRRQPRRCSATRR